MKNLNSDFLQSELTRVTEFIHFADTKTAFVFTVYSLLVGFWITKLDSIRCEISTNRVVFCLLSLSFLLIGLIFLILAIFPKIKNSISKKSLFFFGDIADMDLNEFQKNYKNTSEKEIQNQILQQIHINSKIANSKMKNIQKSIFFLSVFIFLTILNFI